MFFIWIFHFHFLNIERKININSRNEFTKLRFSPQLTRLTCWSTILVYITLNKIVVQASENFLNCLITDKRDLYNILSSGSMNLFLPSYNSPCISLEYLKECYFQKCFAISKEKINPKKLTRYCTIFELIDKL